MLTDDDLDRAETLAACFWTRPSDGQAARTLLVALVAQVRALTVAGNALADELGRWGFGDFHYGSTGQERSVTGPIAAWRALLGDTTQADPLADAPEPGPLSPTMDLSGPT